MKPSAKSSRPLKASARGRVVDFDVMHYAADAVGLVIEALVDSEGGLVLPASRKTAETAISAQTGTAA
jgi:hypothetical protein